MENNEIRAPIKNQPLRVLFQIQLFTVITNLLSVVFGNLMLFYTTVVLLPIELYMIATMIYTIWNMFNDPILGYGCDRTTRWTGKYGKRFPFIVLGVIGSALVLILMFYVPIPNPSMNPILVFIWLLIIYCVYDTFFALMNVNWQSLLQYKIRTNEDRMKSGGFTIVTGTIGMMMAIILQPLIVSIFGMASILAWTLQAATFAGIILIVLVTMIPGIRESRELKAHRAEVVDCKDQISFFKALFTAVKSRSYDAYMIGMVAYSLTISMAQSSLSYFVIYVLGLDFTATIIPMMMLLFIAPLSAPIWYKLGKRIGSKKVYALSFILIAALFVPFLFITDYTVMLIVFAFFGAAVGCNGVMQYPIDADVIEEAATRTGTRNEGVYNGIQTFFTTLPIGMSASIIGAVQLLTGFDPASIIQTDLAILGIRLIISIIPLIILIIGVVLFWILYDITPEKRVKISEKLAEMNL